MAVEVPMEQGGSGGPDGAGWRGAQAAPLIGFTCGVFVISFKSRCIKYRFTRGVWSLVFKIGVLSVHMGRASGYIICSMIVYLSFFLSNPSTHQEVS